MQLRGIEIPDEIYDLYKQRCLLFGLRGVINSNRYATVGESESLEYSTWTGTVSPIFENPQDPSERYEGCKAYFVLRGKKILFYQLSQTTFSIKRFIC